MQSIKALRILNLNIVHSLPKKKDKDKIRKIRFFID